MDDVMYHNAKQASSDAVRGSMQECQQFCIGVSEKK